MLYLISRQIRPRPPPRRRHRRGRGLRRRRREWGAGDDVDAAEQSDGDGGGVGGGPRPEGVRAAARSTRRRGRMRKGDPDPPTQRPTWGAPLHSWSPHPPRPHSTRTPRSSWTLTPTCAAVALHKNKTYQYSRNCLIASRFVTRKILLLKKIESHALWLVRSYRRLANKH